MPKLSFNILSEAGQSVQTHKGLEGPCKAAAVHPADPVSAQQLFTKPKRKSELLVPNCSAGHYVLQKAP